MSKFCQNCGNEIDEKAVICVKCGVPVSGTVEEKKKKDPTLAAVLSLVVIGLGQIYNGEWAKGIGLMIATIVLALLFFPLILITYAYAIYDAYTTAKRLNGETGA